VTILVSLDSPVGQHEGGQVAAPVFKRIAEQVLAYLNVPRDVPLSAKLMQASYRVQKRKRLHRWEDFTPVDFAAQPDRRRHRKKAISSTLQSRRLRSLWTKAATLPCRISWQDHA